MKKKTQLLFKTFVLCFILFISNSRNSYAEEHDFSFGIVPQFDSRRISHIWSPILKQLENMTGMKFKLVGSTSIPRFEKEFLSGKFDFAYLNPYHLILANHSQGYLPLVRDTERKLFGILVVRKDSPISTVQDLAGQIVAFPAPNALGACLLMRAEFHRVFKIQVLPKFVKSHSSVYLNVVLKQTNAGGGVQKTFELQPDSIKNELKIIHKTSKVAPHPISVHPRVPKAIRIKVQAALLNMDNSEDGKKRIAKIPMKKIGKAKLEDYLPLRKYRLHEFYVN